MAGSLTRAGNNPASCLQGYINTMKTNFGNIDLTDTWFDGAINLETAVNIIDMEALSAKSMSQCMHGDGKKYIYSASFVRC